MAVSALPLLTKALLNGVEELGELCAHGDYLRLGVCGQVQGSRPQILARCGGVVRGMAGREPVSWERPKSHVALAAERVRRQYGS
jgi:hypothetical protein